MKKLSFREVYTLPNKDIYYGKGGWIKAKCDKCNTITIWNSRKTGIKCNDGKCAICSGPVKRTTWSDKTDYVLQE